jgi:hypothetical protein
MCITSNGPFIVPREAQGDLGWLPTTEWGFDIVDGEARPRSARTDQMPTRGEAALPHLRSVSAATRLFMGSCRIVFGVVLLSLSACGGKSNGGDEGGMSAGSSDGSSSAAIDSGVASALSGADSGTARPGTNSTPPPGNGPTPSDAGAPGIHDAAPSGCILGPGGGGTAGGGGGAVSCDVMVQETCAGVNYQVTCACPQGSCACFGPASSIGSFSGCPTCPTVAQAFQSCGFPQ